MLHLRAEVACRSVRASSAALCVLQVWARGVSAAGNLTVGVWRGGVLVGEFQRPFHRVGNSQKMGGCCGAMEL